MVAGLGVGVSVVALQGSLAIVSARGAPPRSTTALATPTMTTQASGSVPAGLNIYDTATLSGGNAPTGTITFKLYGPGDTACRTALAAQGPPTNVNGNGTYTSYIQQTTKQGT